MPTYPKAEDVYVSDLVPDRKNPRLPRPFPDTERDTYIRMAEVLGGKLVSLGSDIVKKGALNPAMNFITIPGDGDQRIVLDGNRRLTALRALETPEVVEAALSPAHMKQIKALHKVYTSQDENGLPVEEVRCVVFPNREEANKWIELIHEGEQEGAGLVEWTAQQKARHRDNNAQTKSYYMQVLDFVMQNGKVSDATRQRYDAGKYPVSTLERTLSTPEVRHMLGIDFKDGEVTTLYPKKELLKGVTRVVDEIGSGKKKVGDVMKKTQRIGYVEGFGKDGLPDSDMKGEVARPIEQTPDTEPSGGSSSSSSKDRKHSSARKKLIPRDFSVEIGVSRINDIYIELKRRLLLKDAPNATGALLRVFLELSVDDYTKRNGLPEKNYFRHKVEAVADHMQASKILTKNQLLPVREAVKEPKKGNLVTTLHAFVHNPDFQPTPTDLIAIWDRLSVFIGKLWD